MRAIRQQTLGGPEVLELVDAPRPEPAPTEVLVRAAAAGVNPVDWKTRTRGGFLGTPPFTVGWDIAGVVEEVGRGVTRFEPGDRVFGMPRFPREAAAYAEYVTSPSRQLIAAPGQVTAPPSDLIRATTSLIASPWLLIMASGSLITRVLLKML